MDSILVQDKITAIIVDDEVHARQAMRNELEAFTAIEVVAECEHGLSAVKAVHELKPQVMFLDVHMPKLDGFDVLDLLGDDAPVTVFVTAYDEYAIQAFELNALDYLLKPVSKERLQKTIERLQKQLNGLAGNQHHQKNNSVVVDAHKKMSPPLRRLLVRDKSDVHVIPVEDIYYIESANDYVVIHTEQKNYIKQERLQNLEDTLDPQVFCRVHRTSIINIDYLAGIETETKDSKVVIMKNKDRQAVSRSGYQKLVKLLS